MTSLLPDMPPLFLAARLNGDSGVLVDGALLLIGLLIALATIWLQWAYFKKHHPPPAPRKGDGQSSYVRWRGLFWREVRATLLVAFIALCLVAFTVFYYREITMVSLVSGLFWMGMFFYNLWLAQWYAWRITTRRRR